MQMLFNNHPALSEKLYDKLWLYLKITLLHDFLFHLNFVLTIGSHCEKAFTLYTLHLKHRVSTSLATCRDKNHKFLF